MLGPSDASSKDDLDDDFDDADDTELLLEPSSPVATASSIEARSAGVTDGTLLVLIGSGGEEFSA